MPYLPVTVDGGLTLIRQPGLLAFVGPICAYPVGFLFHLTISADSRALDRGQPTAPSPRLVDFSARTADEKQSAARIQVRFSDGRAAESGDDTADGPTPADIVLNYSGGTSLLYRSDPAPVAESYWWVSPLPPAGPVHFTVMLPGLPGGAGSAAFDASLITAAASKSARLWPDPKTGSP